ncbi:MAG: hypothetical protein AUK47_20505 [Deltaproteobacteria bacterium CG2_30_63_29]|nr:MAG: hypothetical protein AUK47_20505 [Deltaproteobacteria bacterium CG2_30_63_29]
MTSSYFRFPTIHGDNVVFVCEDDLWSVSATGGIARRLTVGLGEVSYPSLSPDGKHLAFSSNDEGATEVFVMPGEGGSARRLTFGGHLAHVVGWLPDGSGIVYSTEASQPFSKTRALRVVPVGGGESKRLGIGLAVYLSFGPDGGRVLCRNMDDNAMWKRYRGGRAGVLWIDRKGDGEFERLLHLEGNTVRPLWIARRDAAGSLRDSSVPCSARAPIDERIYFVSDHEGVGNLYSCDLLGQNLIRHTAHDFYVRHPATDGLAIVYHCGADLYRFELSTLQTVRLDVRTLSSRPQRNRRFVHADEFLEEATLTPSCDSVMLTTRGQTFVMGFWEGAATHRGRGSGTRQRLTHALGDGKHWVSVVDDGREEALEILSASDVPPIRLDKLDLGRAVELRVSPVADAVAVSNHRHELWYVDLRTKHAKLLDRSDFERVDDFEFAPDGRTLVYAIDESPTGSSIKLVDLESGEKHWITRGEFRDSGPSFDPEGRYLYFLSHRDFDPVYDAQTFDLGFPMGMRLCLVTLQSTLTSPFIPMPHPIDDDKDLDDKASDEVRELLRLDAEERADLEDLPLIIDFEGIELRVELFPVKAGQFGRIAGVKDKVFYTSFPLEGTLESEWTGEETEEGVLKAWDFEDNESNPVMTEVIDFDIGEDCKTLLVVCEDRLRVISSHHSMEKDEDDDEPGRKSGWIDLERISVEVSPGDEWRQMLREAWRLMRDNFWSEDMSGVDWQATYERYAPLVDRVSSRTEFSDLVWEMQGELGTSHAYEYGGDYRLSPAYEPGFLGIDVSYDEARKGFRIDHIVQGDAWDPAASSPLLRPGLGVVKGDVITAVGGVSVGPRSTLQSLLVNKAEEEVELKIAAAKGEPRVITVRTLGNEELARYRDWVASNRRFVHEKSQGKVGYLHIPDMGPRGFSEFSRGFLMEAAKPALIVDVRFNRGGHVSPLILEKLARRRLGYDVQRWGGPLPYPSESVDGPIVALTNEHAGSDGDIFSHCFKLMKLGPLIGKRTWGGVVGIWPRHDLIDGSTTSQPEFAFWFQDVGWAVENYGTAPDIEVEIRPQDYAAGLDPQLERGIDEALQRLTENPPLVPDFTGRPDRRVDDRFSHRKRSK